MSCVDTYSSDKSRIHLLGYNSPRETIIEGVVTSTYTSKLEQVQRYSIPELLAESHPMAVCSIHTIIILRFKLILSRSHYLSI